MAHKTRSHFWQGFLDGAPFILVLAPFGVLFGVVGTEAGLNLSQVMGFAVLVIAGAAQFATLQQMVEDVPTIIAVFTGLVVNVRMAMYSASLVPIFGDSPLWKRSILSYLMVDQAYALSVAKHDAQPSMSMAERYSYYFGIMVLIAPTWYIVTLIGALVGQSIPPEYALDFALPITFLALIAPALRTIAHVATALTSVSIALMLAFLPYNLGLLFAAILAMMVGAQVELWMQKKGAP